jgi:glycosyltransferase involved in cell wall biosynthesis
MNPTAIARNFIRLGLAVTRGVVARVRRRAAFTLGVRLGYLEHHAPHPLTLPPAPTHSLTATPRVAIVTPSFHQGGFIGRTIESVLSQNYLALDYFVQDGGSRDETVSVLESYGDRLVWASAPDGGQTQAINAGFRQVSGEIMAWVNSDDLLLPGAIHAVVDYFNRHPDIDVIYGDRVLIDTDDQEIGRWILPGHDAKVLTWVDYVPQETLFWRRRIWDAVGGAVDESFAFAMDWDLLLRFADAGAKFAHLPRPLGAFRVHPHQKTSALIGDIGLAEMNRIRLRIHGHVPTAAEIRRAVWPFLTRHVAARSIRS